MDPGTAGHLPDARPLASSAMREAGLDELYNSRKAAQQLEAALCPPVGDGSLLQPELFHMELQGALTALRDSDKPAVRAFVRDELAPLLRRIHSQQQQLRVQKDTLTQKQNELTQKLYDTMTGIQLRRLPDPFGWSVKVCNA